MNKRFPKFFMFFMIFSGMIFTSNIHSFVFASNGEALWIQYPSEALPAPDFELKRLSGDEKISLHQYKGKIVLINFWATWCQPCLQEMPSLNALYNKFKEKGLVVLAVSTDRGRESAVKKFTIDHALQFPVLLDPEGTVRNRYEVNALPYSYIIDREGKFIGRVIGERDWVVPRIVNYFIRIIKERLSDKRKIVTNK